MIIAAPKERVAGEKRVALTPAAAAALKKLGHEVWIETEAGVIAGFPDRLYTEAGARMVGDRAELLTQADVLLQVRTSDETGESQRKAGQIRIGLAEPLMSAELINQINAAGLTLFSMELL